MNALGVILGGLFFAISVFLFEAVVVMFAVRGLLSPEALAAVFGTFGFGKAVLLTLLIRIPAGVIKYASKS